MVDILLISLLFDTGLFILIWMVQWVVYPSFLFYTEQDLKRWHLTYTRRITCIVLPLMLGQLVLTFWHAFLDASLMAYAKCVLVVLIWVITFLLAVPLHRSLDHDDNTLASRQELIRVNMYRTALWTIVFVLSIVIYGA